jgi:hypothetical protein
MSAAVESNTPGTLGSVGANERAQPPRGDVTRVVCASSENNSGFRHLSCISSARPPWWLGRKASGKVAPYDFKGIGLRISGIGPNEKEIISVRVALYESSGVDSVHVFVFLQGS